VNAGKRRFATDPRLHLRNMNAGFASRADNSSVDARLLERICDSYMKAANRESFAPASYQPTEWWEQHRKISLKPVIQALRSRDTEAPKCDVPAFLP
jgi:hypothetical protein